MKNIIILCFSICLSFNLLKADITENVVNLYNPVTSYENLEKDLNFWTHKIADNPDQTYLKKRAGVYAQMFALDGDVQNLSYAETDLMQVLSEYNIDAAASLRALAQIQIKQHRFCEALDNNLKAESIGSNMRSTELLFFDIYFELDNGGQVDYYLNRLSGIQDFDYLIRLARWEDGNGQLDKAIQLLEAAKEQVSTNDIYRLNWIYSNLADFYGHDGQIQKSGEYFIKALELNNSDWYSLKGLAWIAFSKNGNKEQSMRIVDKIDLYFDIPAVKKLKIEIMNQLEKYEDAEIEKLYLMEKIKSLNAESMYASMLFDLWINDNHQKQSLKHLIDHEIGERPGPAAYAMLAAFEFKNGNQDLALQLTEEHVLDKTYEPLPLKRVLDVLPKNHAAFKTVSDAVNEARYELGPK